MSDNLTNLFDENTAAEGSTGTRSLAGTAQLTSTSASIANEILKTIESDFGTYRVEVTASKARHEAMDTLVTSVYDLNSLDIDFLKELDETVLDSMLKSQQSKRSRAKSKPMTMDNYRSMMTAAIAENLIRLATGNVKSATTSRRSAGSIEYTDDQLAELGADQEKLRKEIRNVQSKKSIEKAKDDFTEESERWQKLLVAEAQLKGMRVETTRVVQIDETKNKLSELLGDKDLHALKPSEAKKILEALTASEEPVEVEVNE